MNNKTPLEKLGEGCFAVVLVFLLVVFLFIKSRL